MEKINTHNHTTYCGHAQDSMSTMVDAALAAGIETFAFTEHYPMIEPYDDCGYISMLYADEQRYCDEVMEHRRAHPEMEILLGTEVDWLGSAENRDLASEDWSRFELILGSVHFIDGWGFDDPAYMHRWDEMGVDDVWRRYFQIWCDATTSDMPFHVMAHPDLVKKFGYFPNFDPSRLYLRPHLPRRGLPHHRRQQRCCREGRKVCDGQRERARSGRGIYFGSGRRMRGI